MGSRVFEMIDVVYNLSPLGAIYTTIFHSGSSFLVVFFH